MPGYQLQPNEAFVHKFDGVLYGGLLANYTDELMLTSRNLVHIRKGLWGNKKGIRAFPLSRLKVFQGAAQAFGVEREEGSPELELYFLDGIERFGFEEKKEAQLFARKINEVITGAPAVEPDLDPEQTGSSGSLAEELRSVADELKGALGFGRNTKKTPAPAPAPVTAASATGDCVSCGAPFLGFQGRAVVCDYCDTPNQL